MISQISLWIKSTYPLFKLVRNALSWTGYYKGILKKEPPADWKERIDTVMRCPDNQLISRVANAGEISGDTQVMHNGIRIHIGSYYGDGNTHLLYRNRGVHEPQEEKVFDEIVKLLPPDATMIELGSFWAFYSMTFLMHRPAGKSFLVEPDHHALVSGKNNFRLNNLRGSFFNHFVGDAVVPGAVSTITVDHFMTEHRLQRLNMLHADIQGAELNMLKGAMNGLRSRTIDYIFISTHSNDLHTQCMELLESVGYRVLCDADLDETFSWDGLIVACGPHIHEPASLGISRR